jgi:hypothetical protein
VLLTRSLPLMFFPLDSKQLPSYWERAEQVHLSRVASRRIGYSGGKTRTRSRPAHQAAHPTARTKNCTHDLSREPRRGTRRAEKSALFRRHRVVWALVRAESRLTMSASMAARRAILLLSALCAGVGFFHGVVAAPDYVTVSAASFASASTCSALGPGAYATRFHGVRYGSFEHSCW